ncbi:uncharacterized protein LOC120169815 [Hibiscus syriacus]|uniref:uncharacterized protein LOC120169815 n=1 Tax=Hibiscus syriacus TaxID=106335 RepID=UPI0019218CB1|nr:uncharacterized protein LOC120169815 [Hibiscus syriacus]
MLNLAASKGIFDFHLKCKKIGFSHLSFTDDLLIFYKENFDLVADVLTILDQFYEFSGLKLNSSKCEFFTTGISSRDLEDIKFLSGFKSGSLPVRYLGIPLITRKLTMKDCDPLLEKIKLRLHHWQLVLLASILKAVDQLCARFFWKGEDKTVVGARADSGISRLQQTLVGASKES